jgi:hypothetical protein
MLSRSQTGFEAHQTVTWALFQQVKNSRGVTILPSLPSIFKAKNGQIYNSNPLNIHGVNVILPKDNFSFTYGLTLP